MVLRLAASTPQISAWITDKSFPPPSSNNAKVDQLGSLPTSSFELRTFRLSIPSELPFRAKIFIANQIEIPALCLIHASQSSILEIARNRADFTRSLKTR